MKRSRPNWIISVVTCPEWKKKTTGFLFTLFYFAHTLHVETCVCVCVCSCVGPVELELEVRVRGGVFLSLSLTLPWRPPPFSSSLSSLFPLQFPSERDAKKGNIWESKRRGEASSGYLNTPYLTHTHNSTDSFPLWWHFLHLHLKGEPLLTPLGMIFLSRFQ